MKFLCAQVCVSVFLMLFNFLKLSILSYFDLFIWLVGWSWLTICFPVREKERRAVFERVVRWGGYGKSWGRGGHDQTMLYKNIFSINKDINFKRERKRA